MKSKKAEQPRLYRLSKKTIREIVLDRLDDLGASRYDMARYADIPPGGPPRSKRGPTSKQAAESTIYRFLSGESDRISLPVLEAILRAVGLSLALVDTGVPDWCSDRARNA